MLDIRRAVSAVWRTQTQVVRDFLVTTLPHTAVSNIHQQQLGDLAQRPRARSCNQNDILLHHVALSFSLANRQFVPSYP